MVARSPDPRHRDVHLFDRVPKRRALGFVEILDGVLVTDVAVAVDEHAHRAQLTHGAANFGGRVDRILQGHAREGTEPIPVLAVDVEL